MPHAEPYRGQYDATTSIRFWYAVTPGADDLPTMPRLVHARVGGTIAMVDQAGNTATWAFADGETLPLSPRKILAAGTTATGIVAGY